ncbi:MAG: PaaI family thioesterase [Ruminiclostridium sp.]|nr:PaaI family thioesterase [Ruminiclostridium sp.]
MDSNLIQYIQNDRFAKLVGTKLVELKPGYARVQMEVTENHLNGVNMVQGGAIFSLADYAFAAACNSSGMLTVGINVNISYIKSPRGKVLTATANEVSSGKKICTVHIDVRDENNDLIAVVQATGYRK